MSHALSRTPTRTVVVFGVSSGIGRASALRLAGEGANVVLVSRSKESLAEPSWSAWLPAGQL